MRADLLNGAALGLALVAATFGALQGGETSDERAAPVVAVPAAPAGASELADARGQRVPARDYARVLSLHPVGDHLLRELLEPERLVAITDYTSTQHPEGWRYGDHATIGTSRDIEAILALQPELVVVSNFAEEARMERLREAGIQVFDLGEARGVETTLAGIDALGVLLRQPRRARLLRDRLERELAALEAARPAERPEGLWLTVFGDSIFGGTAGTSYADLLHYGGVVDLAAQHGHLAWPKYTPEQLLRMDPALVLTQEGMGRAICDHSLLQQLAACGPQGRILELDEGYEGDPGLGIVEGAAKIQRLLAAEPVPR